MSITSYYTSEGITILNRREMSIYSHSLGFSTGQCRYCNTTDFSPSLGPGIDT